MAENLGEVSLRLSVEDATRAGFEAVRQNAEKVSQQVSAAFQRVKGFSGISDNARLAGKTLDGLEQKVRELRAELGKTSFGTQRFKELQGEIRKTEQEINKLNGVARNTNPVVSGIVGSLTGIFTVGAVVGLFKGAIDEAIQLESITRKLSNTLGEGGAAKALAFTRGLADQLGLSFKTLASSFGSFTAAATAAGVPLEKQRALFASVAKSAQQLGLSNEELSGSLLALQQIASKGTVQMEELRGQLGERLPIAFGATAKGLGITQRELIKLVESGRLSSGDFFEGLTKGLNELAATSQGAPTTAQNIAQLQNAWQALQAAFGENLLPLVTKTIKDLGAVVDGLGVKLTADRLGFGTGAAGAFGIISQAAVQAADGYKQLRNEFALTDKQATALFFDARKAEGLAPFGPLNEEQTGKVLSRLRQLAEEYRKRFPIKEPIINEEVADSSLNSISKIQERIKALQGERIGLDFGSERFAAISKELAFLQGALNSLSGADISSAAQEIVQASQFRLEAAQRAVGLEGEALAILQQQLAVEEARRKEAQAFGAYNDAFRGANGDSSNPAVIEAAARYEEAANNTRAALIEGAEKTRQALQQAADSLRGSSVAAFKFLSPDAQRAIFQGLQGGIDRLQERLGALANNAAIDAAQRDLGRTGDISGLNQLFDTLKNQVQNLKGITDASSLTNAALASNTAALNSVAQKNWLVDVKVNANGAQVYGDALLGALQP